MQLGLPMALCCAQLALRAPSLLHRRRAVQPLPLIMRVLVQGPLPHLQLQLLRAHHEPLTALPQRR